MTTSNFSIYCPYCGRVHTSWQDYIDTGDMEGEFEACCEKCKRTFKVKFTTVIKFETSKQCSSKEV